MIRFIIFILFCCIIASICSCRNKNTSHITKATQVLADADSSINKLNSNIDKLGAAIRFLDSNLKYERLSKEMELKMAQSESDYYRTGNEKYYRQFYKYRKKQWYYVGLANKYNDSVKMLPK